MSFAPRQQTAIAWKYEYPKLSGKPTKIELGTVKFRIQDYIEDAEELIIKQFPTATHFTCYDEYHNKYFIGVIDK